VAGVAFYFALHAARSSERERAIDNIPLSAVISGYAIAYYCVRRCRLQQNNKLGGTASVVLHMRMSS
jgi:hypothetical protein